MRRVSHSEFVSYLRTRQSSLPLSSATLTYLLRHVLNILVSDDVASLAHGSGGGSLDLFLCVPHASSDLGDDLGEALGELLGGSLGENGDHVKSGAADLPLLLDGELLEDDGKETLHGEGADLLGDVRRAGNRGFPDRSRLTGSSIEDALEAHLEVGLSLGEVGKAGDSIDGSKSLGLVLLSAKRGELQHLGGKVRLDNSLGFHSGSEVSGLADRKLLHGSNKSSHYIIL